MSRRRRLIVEIEDFGVNLGKIAENSAALFGF